MSIFEYQAVDINGKSDNGLIEGDTLKSARKQLQNRNLAVIEIKQSNRRLVRAKSLFGARLSISDISIITRQLASLLQAAMPIDEALQTIARNNNKKHIKKTVGQIRSSVIEGKSLAESLQINAKELPPYFISTVEAGERSGELGNILHKLANEIQQQDKFKKKISAALIYPMMISIVAMMVVVSLLIFVVPQIVSVFDNMNQALPPLTVAVIALSDFLSTNIWSIILLLVLVIIGIKVALQQQKIKTKFQNILGKLPVVGKLMIESNATRFARTFALLHEGGTPILTALKNSADSLNFLPMKNAILLATEKVREGSTIFKALESQNALPSMTLYMLASGEASGQLSEMLNKAADNQEVELDAYTTKITSLFEPIMILLMGGVVLLIVLAILLPIFELNQIAL